MRRPNGNLKLLPGEWSADEWRRVTAKYLDPYKEDVKVILLLAGSTVVDPRELPLEVRQWLSRPAAGQGAAGYAEQGALFG